MGVGFRDTIDFVHLAQPQPGPRILGLDFHHHNNIRFAPTEVDSPDLRDTGEGLDYITRPCRLVPPTRIERVTYGLGNRRSIQLSYGGVSVFRYHTPLNRWPQAPFW